jgi:hypothetical protein
LQCLRVTPRVGGTAKHKLRDAMEDKAYEVEVTFRQRAIYRVHAPDRETAERIAVERWQEGGESMVAGFDWSELEGVQASDARDSDREGEDAELVLRFLRERERLILRLGAGILGPSPNDAISAAQVASDLGWSRRPASGGPAIADVPRATLALERLCEERRVVCFQRPRVRSGERGEIRLYCTPEYLDRLTSEIGDLERQAS